MNTNYNEHQFYQMIWVLETTDPQIQVRQVRNVTEFCTTKKFFILLFFI